MSLENPLGLGVRAEKQVSPETRKALDQFRSKLIGALALGSSVFLEACGGLTKEDIEKMPLTTIEQIAQNPDILRELPLLKTEGYPVETGEKIVKIPIFRATKIGKTTFYRMDWITSKKNTYNIYSSKSLSGTSVEMVSDAKMTYMVFVPSTPSDAISTPETHKHQIVAKIVKAKDKDNNERFVINLESVVDLEAPVAVRKK